MKTASAQKEVITHLNLPYIAINSYINTCKEKATKTCAINCLVFLSCSFKEKNMNPLYL